MAKREETVTEKPGSRSRLLTIDKADLIAFGGKVRLDRFLAQALPELSRSRIQELISSGGVSVNGKQAKASLSLTGGEQVTVALEQLPSRESGVEPRPLDVPLEILFEDDSVIVVNKPAGVTVHPGAGTQGETTLVHALLYHCGTLPEATDPGSDEDPEDAVNEGGASPAGAGNAQQALAALRPGIVHRLDRDTSGVMVVAKSAEAHRDLAAQFHDKTNFRQYLVLCSGPMPVDVVVRESWLGRDPAHRTRFRSWDEDAPGRKYAKTVFRREESFAGGMTLLSARLYTGRTHQIRVHARDLGMPVTGDASYGDDSRVTREVSELATRQMLHAWKLGFRHPVTGAQLEFEAPLPPDFTKILVHLSGLPKS